MDLMYGDMHEVGSNDVTRSMVRVLARQKQGLRVCHLNSQSLRPKIDEFRWIFEGSGIDIICVSETWLNNLIPNGFVSLYGYKIYRFDRAIGRGGGVAIYVRNHITCRLCTGTEVNDRIEHILVEISSFGRKMLVGCVCRPNNLVEYGNFIASIEDYVLRYDDVLIAGDFNSNLLVDETFKDEMEAIGLTPLNTRIPTHFTGNSSTLLDLMFVGDARRKLLYDQISASCFSKHDLIYITYDFQLGSGEQSFCFRDFRDVNYNTLYTNVLLIIWDCIYDMAEVDDQLFFS